MKLAPSKRNKLFDEIPVPPGRLCFATIVYGTYQWYIPLFVYSCKKAYPDADIKIVLRGPCELPERHLIYVDREPNEPRLNDPCYTTAALRFTWDYESIEQCEYALITDIDLLHRKETQSLVHTRMRDLRMYDLQCYSNYVSGMDCGEDRMPGVHFVTKDWWHRTAVARKKWQEHLLTHGADSYSFDERMITKIVAESGLPIQKGEMKLWQMHGLHLGDWRKRILRHERQMPVLNAYDQMYVKSCLEDLSFMALVDECSEHIPTIKQTFELLARDIRLT